jgi:ketosteroid isomerase-like protein
VSTSMAISGGGDARQIDTVNLILRFFTELSKGRYDDAQALLTPRASWWVLHKRGHVDPAVWFSGLAKLFPEGLRFEIVGVTVQGPRVAVRAVARGTTVTGREFDNAYHFLFEVEGGRISAGWEYGDTLHADRVLRG